MHAPLRAITDMDITTALTKLFAALPPRKGNPAELTDSYKLALQGCTSAGLAQTVLQYIQGDVDGMATSFAPTPPELSRAVRSIDRQLEAVNRPPALEYTPLPFLTVEMRRDAERQRMAAEGRKLICSADSHGAAQEMAKRGKVPPGSVYSGLLGEFYSPINYQPEGTADEQRHPDDTRRQSERPEDFPADLQSAAPGDDTRHDWRKLFDTGEPTGELGGQSKASDTIDGDRGSTGAFNATGGN